MDTFSTVGTRPPPAEDAADQQQVARLLVLLEQRQIDNAVVRELILKRCVRALLGPDALLEARIQDAIGAGLDEAASLARNLRQVLPERREATVPPAAMPEPLANASALPSDDAIKDRISRVYMQTTAFQISLGMLAVGLILFGIKLNGLSLDASAVERIRSEAQIAAITAKAQADGARVAVQSVVDEVRGEALKLVNEKVAEARSEALQRLIDRIETGQVERRAAELAADRVDVAAIRTRIADFDGELKHGADRLTSLGRHIDTLFARTDTVVDANQRANESISQTVRLNHDVLSGQRTLIDALRIADRASADPSWARIVWLVLSHHGALVLVGLVASLAALGLSGFVVWRSRASSDAPASVRPR